MPRNVNDIMNKRTRAQRRKVEARAAQLIAEEMTLQELRRARKITAEDRKIPQYRPGRRLEDRKAQRPSDFHSPPDCGGYGRKLVSGG